MKFDFLKFFPLLAVALVKAPDMQAQALPLRTMAGGSTPGMADGFGSNAHFDHPSGIVADFGGNIFIADTGNGIIRKITPDGYASTLAGLAGYLGNTDGGGTNARFSGPQGVAVDSDGQVLVADSGNGTIRKVTGTGNVTTIAGASGDFNSLDGSGTNARFYHPEGLAVDAVGNIYVTDTWNHTLRKFTADGVVTTLAGLAGNPGAKDGANSKARFNRPSGIAIDSATNLFVADSLNHTIRMITPDGRVSTIAGLAGVWGSADGTNRSARFYLPQGISVSSSGDIFVADSGNQMLRKISRDGTNWVVRTVAGASGLAGNINGPGNSARLNFPAALALDAAGFLYVGDSGNNMLRTTRLIQPTLQCTVMGRNLALSWPVSAEGFVLEQATDLGSESAAWSMVTDGIVADGDNFVQTNSMIGAAYYRLRFP